MTSAVPMGEALDRRLRYILQAGDFPALSKLFTETMGILEDHDSSSQRLANLVLRDYSLTVKVIRTANTLHYNRTGKPIRSATHAMLLLGVRTVRDLATSLILFEHYHQRSPGLKELMLSSMLTATHARELAMRLGLPDPEEAHLCGMFRNLGEVLIAAHFPDEYARILQKVRAARSASGPNAEWGTDAAGIQTAATSVLAFTYEDLGVAVARHWRMPESVIDSMRATGPSIKPGLIGVVKFSHELTTAIYRDESKRGATRLADAVRRHGAALDVELAEVGEVIERAIAETREVFATAQVSLDDLRLRKQTADALRFLGAEAEAEGSGPVVVEESTAELRQQLRQRLVQEAEAALAPDGGYGLEAVVLMLLEALLRGGPFDRVVFALTNADRTMVEGRLGLGDGVDELIARLRLSTRAAPVAACLRSRGAVLRAVDDALASDEVEWCAAVGAVAFGVAPLVVDARLVGCIYADCVRPYADVDAATAPFFETVAGLAARAIALRAHAVRATPPSAR